jgi:hypothetical protein
MRNVPALAAAGKPRLRRGDAPAASCPWSQARPIVSPRLIPPSRLAQSCSRTVEAQGATMRLLLIFIICLLFGQSLSIGVGLLVERYSTPYTGLVTFITSYFAMFWLAWRVAVRITRPRSRVAAE